MTPPPLACIGFGGKLFEMIHPPFWQMPRVLLVVAMVGASLYPGSASAFGFPHEITSDCAAAYLNPDTGRFWTMDSYEGNSSEPLSLHKYLYANADPINRIDPSGQNSTLAECGISETIAVGLAATLLVGVVEAKTHALQSLCKSAATAAVVAGESLIDTARSAIQAAGKTLQGLIEDAKQIMGLLRNSPVKVIPMPRCVIPDVANHVANAQALGFPGFPVPLTRCNPAQAAANRQAALVGLGYAFPNSWDEYPFASSWQGGAWTSVAPVPLWQNLVQGGIIAACYKLENITYAPPTPYFVIVTP